MNDHSGKFVLRLPSHLHKTLALKAKRQGVSLNTVCVSILSGEKAEKEDSVIFKAFGNVLPDVKKHFGNHLLGIVAFGSQVTHEATETSDIDFLLILDETVEITRSLYRWWDEGIKFSGESVVNPHFVTFPANLEEVSGIWFEVAEHHIILYQQGKRIEKLFKNLSDMIDRGVVRRLISNGHPYWVWRKHEK